MSDQTNLPQQSTQGQDALQQFGVTQKEVSDFQQGDPQLEDYDFDNDMMLGVETGFVGFPDIPADQMFTDAPQTQEAQQGQPPNTEGPCYNPKVQWHYLSTLPAGVQPLEYSDMNFDGPYYAPSTGWYFKMLNPPGAQLMPPMPFPGVKEGYTPSPYSSVVLSGVVTPIAPPSHVRVPPAAPTRPQKLSTPKARPVGKQKYGQQAYLEAQKKGSVSTPPRAPSLSEAHYTSAAHRRNHQSSDVPATTSFRLKNKHPSIVQACVCSDKAANKIKRPRNAFILYRSSRKETIMKSHKSRDNQNVSKQAALMWKAEPEAVKQHFHALAAQEAARHRADHPDYKYEPGLATRAKFGSASCTCGAYQINMSKLIRKRSAAVAFNADLEADDAFSEDEGADGDASVPPRSMQAAPSPYTYPMPAHLSQRPSFPQDPMLFGSMSGHPVQGPAPVAVMNPKRKRAADEQPAERGMEPKRLRSASKNAQVSYAEAGDFNFDLVEGVDGSSVDFDFGFDTGVDPAQLRKSSRRQTQTPADLDSVQQFNNLGVDPNTSPARNTRARSKARISPPTTATGMGADMLDMGEDFSSFLAPDPMDDAALAELFGEHEPLLNGDEELDFGDNIVVASRRLSQEEPSHSYSLRPRGGSKSLEQR